MSELKVAICIPSGDMWHADFAFDLLGMCMWTLQATEGLALCPFNRRLSVLPTARNHLVRDACKSGAHYVLFLDSDMRFPVDTLTRMLNAKKPIVAANCVQRCFPTRATAWSDGRHVFTDDSKSGLEEVESIGTAVMLIDTRVFQVMEPPFFFFEPKPDDKLSFLGEDQFFCREARKAGFGVWIDHDLSRAVAHVGTLGYTHEMAVACRDKVPILLNGLNLNTPTNATVVKESTP